MATITGTDVNISTVTSSGVGATIVNKTDTGFGVKGVVEGSYTITVTLSDSTKLTATVTVNALNIFSNFSKNGYVTATGVTSSTNDKAMASFLQLPKNTNVKIYLSALPTNFVIYGGNANPWVSGGVTGQTKLTSAGTFQTNGLNATYNASGKYISFNTGDYQYFRCSYSGSLTHVKVSQGSLVTVSGDKTTSFSLNNTTGTVEVGGTVSFSVVATQS